jgi:hypothetical protein
MQLSAKSLNVRDVMGYCAEKIVIKAETGG